MPRSIPPIHKKEKPKPHPKPPIARPRPAATRPGVAELFRFPGGTSLFAFYDHYKQKWALKLNVPGEPPREIEADGIHWGIRQIGKAWKKDQDAKKEGADASANRPVA